MSQPEPGAGVAVNVERLSPHRVRLEVSVSAQEVARAFDRAFRRLSSRANIPGFRRGRAPRPVVERHFGREVLRDEAIDLLLNDSYARALETEGLDPIDQPELEVVRFEEGEPFVYKATVDVKPEVTLGQYTGLGLELKPRPVEEADVQRQLEAIADRAAVLEPVEAETLLEDGLFAVVDWHATVDGKSFPGGDMEGALVRMGSHQLDPEIEKALYGAKTGDVRECTVHFSEEAASEDLRGKDALFRIVVKEVKRKKTPDLTDELAIQLTGHDLVSLRGRLRERLEFEAMRQAQEELAHNIIERVTAEATVDLPEKMVERRMARRRAETEARLARGNMNLDDYLRAVGLEREQWEKDLRSRVEHELKREIVLEAIARRQDIQADDGEVAFEMMRYAAATGEKPEKVRREFSSPERLAALRSRIILDKTVQYLVRENTVRPEAAKAPAAPTRDRLQEGGAEPAPDEQSSQEGPEGRPPEGRGDE